MGTRADFYIGNGDNAKWLGSIGWDGYPEGIPIDIKECTNADQFEKTVCEFIKMNNGILAETGWPWPWTSGEMTDYSYFFIKNTVYVSKYGSKAWQAIYNFATDCPKDSEFKTVSFPDMKDKQNVILDRRSGLIVLSR